MNLEKENLNEKLVFCVQKISHKLSVFKLKSGDYRVLKTYFLDSFGLKARALLSLPSSGILNYSENFYLNGIQTTEQSLTHEFIIDSFKPIESDFDINPLNSIELFQKIYRKSLASLMLERIDLSFYDSDMFLGQSSQELELLPSPYFSFSDFQSLSDILSELPADTIFSFAPYLMSGAKSNESDVQSHAIAISFFRYIRVNYLPKELELFYSEEEKDWDRDHRRNIERICSHLPAEFVEVARRCFTTSEANSFKSFHEFKFQFLVAEQKRKTQELGNQLAINMRFELLTQRHREILDKITDSIVQPINKKKGDCFLLQGSEESTNSKIIDEVLMAMPEKLVTILHLREEGRSLGVDFNPLYELLNQLLDLICIKLTNSNKLKTEFYESFQSEIIYLAAFNNDLQTVYKDIQISKDFIGIGQINDLELKNLTNKLLQFQLAFTKQILIVIDSKFRIGLSRSKTNSLDFLKLIENMPITIIGDYNPGSVGNNFNYRISEFGKDTVTEFKLEFLDEAEIEEFLLATGLVDHRSTFNLSRKLQSISRGSRENLNSIFSQAVSNKIVFVNSEGNIEWNFSLLTTSKFFLPNNYQPQEVFQGLSPGEKVILKRCALLEGGVDYSFLIQGIEKTGLSGVNKLLERGFISKTLDSKARVGYSVSNNNLRLEILSIMEKREKVFLSIQLARIMSDLDIHASPFIEGALWAQVADYLAANNDKKKAVNSLLSCARELLRISDYQSALSYLDIASIFLTSDSKKYYESVWGEYCVLMAVACFRNKKEKAAEDYFSKALEHSTDIYQTTRIRTEWINLCVLVGDHEKAIGLCEDNFQDLNFKVFGFLNYYWCFRLIFLSWFNLHSIKACLKENRCNPEEKQRLCSLMETVIASAASYFSKDRVKFHLLQGIMTYLSQKLHGTKYSSFSLLNAGVLSGLLFNDLLRSKKYFDKAKLVSEKLGANFVLSRVMSVETMMIGTISLEHKDLLGTLRSVANASLSNRDESFFIFAEQSTYLLEMMSGERAFSRLLRKIESSKYHSLKSNRREAYNSLNALKQNILRFTKHDEHLVFQDLKGGGEGVESYQNLEAFTRLLGSGMTHFFDEQYSSAVNAFSQANSGVFKNYSLPVRAHIAFYLILSRLRARQDNSTIRKIFSYPGFVYSIYKFNRMTKIGCESWKAKRSILKRELQYLLMPSLGLKNYQLTFYQHSNSWSFLDKIIGSSMLSKIYLKKSNLKMSAKLLDKLLVAAEGLEFNRLSQRIISSYSEGSFVLQNETDRSEVILSDHWKKMIDLLVSIQNSNAKNSVEKLVQYTMEFTRAEKLLLVLNEGSQWGNLRLMCKNTSFVADQEQLKEIEIKHVAAIENLIYAMETGRVNRIGNAMFDQSLLDRDYIEQNEVKSIYVMPIYSESKEIGVLYLENNSMENSFSNLSNEIPSILSTMILAAIKKEEDSKKLNHRVQSVEKELSLARQKINSFNQQVESASVANETLHNLVGFLQSLSFEVEKFELEFLKENSISMTYLDEVKSFSKKLADDEIAGAIMQSSEELKSSLDRNGEHLDSLTNNFLNRLQLLKQSIHSQQSIAKGEQNDREFSLSDALQMAEEIMQPNFEKHNIGYRLNAQPEIYIKSIKVLWVQAFVNLFRNSVDALKELKPSNPYIHVDVALKKNHLVLKFKDNGIGFGDEDQGSLAQYGFSTKKDGHGFGLHSVHVLIKGMDGELKFFSEGLGKGCQIEIEIPLNKLK